MSKIILENLRYPILTMKQKVLGPTPHLHKELEIIYVVKGQSRAFVDKKLYTLKTGDLLIVFPHQIHYYREPEEGLYYAILANQNAFFNLSKTFNDYMPTDNLISLDSDSPIPMLLEKTVVTNGKYSLTLKAGLLNQILALALPRLQLKEKIKTSNSTLEHILEYCTANFANSISLDDIAEELHLNKYHISHLFNEKLGLSFNSYVNMLRINIASDFLKETDINIANISEEVGFGSIRSFNRAFFKIMNTTPTEYRNQLKKMK